MLPGAESAGPDKAALLKILQQKAQPNPAALSAGLAPGSQVNNGTPVGTILTDYGDASAAERSIADSQLSAAQGQLPHILGSHPDSKYPADHEFTPMASALQMLSNLNGTAISAYQSDPAEQPASQGWGIDTLDNITNARGAAQYTNLGTDDQWQQFLGSLQGADGGMAQQADASQYQDPATAFLAAQNSDISPEYQALATLIQQYLQDGAAQGRGTFSPVNDRVSGDRPNPLKGY